MGWYEAVGRRAFFALDPETSHRVAQRLLGLPLPWRRIGGASEDPALGTTLTGIPLRNPVGLAAGFDKDCRHLDALGLLGFGFVVGGTVTLRARPGNRRPRIARDPARRALVNAMGLPNAGAHAAARALARSRRTCPRVVSIADEELPDVVAAVEVLAPYVDAIEINASSPNAGWTHRADHLGAICRAVREGSGLPVWAKLPPFAGDGDRDGILAMASAAEAGGASALTCGNTVPVADPRMPTGRGGLSGGPLTERTPRIVAEVRAASGLPVLACGGVFSAEDAAACLEAGAAAVQVYSGLIYGGPGVVGRLTAGLAARVPAAD
ncbi:MAG TPA: nitronate monooxygenase [Actinomycetota bacterium]|nr:nitronate monooxygenase [Actinomycetota bacterium]